MNHLIFMNPILSKIRMWFVITRSSVRRQSVLLIVVLLVCSGTDRIFALNYSIKGTMQYRLQPPNQGAKPTLFRHFELDFDDCTWTIKVYLDRSDIRTAFVQQYDGHNLLTFQVDPDKPGKSSGTVEECSVPETLLASFNEQPWLAFASWCYFREATNGYAISLEAARSPSGYNHRLVVPATVHLSDASPHLPDSIAYLRRQLVFFDTDGNLKTNRISEGYPGVENGYIDAEFRSGGFTNVNGLSFPTTFEFRRNMLVRKGTAKYELYCVAVTTGTATNIIVGKSVGGTKPIPATLYLHDLRVPEPNVLLKVANGVIPSTDSPEILELRKKTEEQFKLQRQAQEKLQQRRSRYRGLLLLAFSLLFVLPLAYFQFARKRAGLVKHQKQ